MAHTPPPTPDSKEALAIPSVDEPGKGYVAIRIGPSNLRPHRSEAKDDKRYYRRASAGTYVMEHYEIVDMLRINTVPKLKLIHKSEPMSVSGLVFRSAITLWLMNESMVTAKSPYLMLKTENIHPIYPNNNFQKRKSFHKGTETLVGGAEESIHPLTKLHVIDLLVKWNAGTESYCHSPDDHFWDYRFNAKPLTITGAFGCENAPCEQFTLEMSAREIESMFDSVRSQGEEMYRRQNNI